MILDDKVAPPPYSSSSPNPNRQTLPSATTQIPSHLLLQIVYHTFPQTPSLDQDKSERQRKTLLWLVISLRTVNKSFYTACMHVLRSTYLPLYQALIRAPYSSDPFPCSDEPDMEANSTAGLPRYPNPSASVLSFASASTSTSSNAPKPSIFFPLQRETLILDKFIALKVREDVFVDDSSLHLEREDYFRDLFELGQPKARLEDLVRIYGVREGVVSVPGLRRRMRREVESVPESKGTESKASTSTSTSTYTPPARQSVPNPPKPKSKFTSFFKRSPSSPISPSTPTSPTSPSPSTQTVPFSSLTISLSPRKVGLILNRTRTIVEISRTRGETLEVLASGLVSGLSEVLRE